MEAGGERREPSFMPMRIRPTGDRRSLSRSATRALDVLELFGEVRRPLRAVEIARALDMSASSTNQLLKTMVESAHLVFDARIKNYAPSPRLARFANWIVVNYGADQVVRHVMTELGRLSGELVTLATPNDLFMLILDHVRQPGTSETPERGFRVSIFGSALGSAYLSSLSNSEIHRLADRARLTPANLAKVTEQVARAKRDGVADGVSLGGQSWSLATPLSPFGHPGPLVLGLSGPVDRIQRRLPELRELIRRVPARHDIGDRSS